MTSDLRNDVSNLRQIGRFSCEVMGSMPTEEKNCKIGGSCAALRAWGDAAAVPSSVQPLQIFQRIPSVGIEPTTFDLRDEISNL